MEYPWRHHPPPPPGNICPICSFSHFPFCPFPQHYPNPNFPNHNPNSHSHYQTPNFQSHCFYPNSQSHDQNPNFQSHNQTPNFQSHHHYPNLQSLDQDPSFQLHEHNPNFQSLDQNPNFQSHNHYPNFQSHDQKLSFLSHDQNPSFGLHNRHTSFIPHDRNPSFQRYDQSPSFQSQDFRPPANFSLENPQIAQIRNPIGDYSPFDHGFKRPRTGELGADDNERRLKLIHDHGGMDSNLLNGEIRNFYHEGSGLKRPRFDESGVGKKNTMSNFNTHYEIVAENELSRRGFGEEPSLKTNFRDNYEQRQRQPGDNIYPKSYGLRNNIPPVHDIRSRAHSNDSAFVNRASPTSLQISPQNKTSFENTNVGIAPGINGPTPLLMDHKEPLFSDQLAISSQSKTSSLFPISVTASPPIASSYDPFSEAQNLAQPYFQDKPHIHGSNGFHAKEYQPVDQRLSMNYQREGQRLPPIPLNKPIAVDASHIFKQPYRATRPDHIVVILRGLPGSGKSYLAKIMRDLEVDNGGNAPRIHSMDDYFMTEVEKVEESDNSKSSRGKKPVVKMVVEYCYEAEMEEAYRSSMLKTFKKTLDEGAFPFVIVDDRNLRAADFAQFWATAKRSGYEVYLLEPTYKDPVGCAARNVHGFTLDDIQKMADQWEEAPSLYLKLDAKSLLQGDNSKENAIQEVDMDTGDGESEDTIYGSAERNTDISAPSTKNLSPSEDDESDDLRDSKAEDSRNVESDHLREEVKELGRSKWSNDLEDDDGEKTEANKEIPNALSAMMKAYKREGKSVHWGDQAANTGFSIGAAKRVNTSLEIGPGSGYNSKSNPLPEHLVVPCNNGNMKTQSVFQERIRAEHESFRAVFDRRRHRIGGLDLDEE